MWRQWNTVRINTYISPYQFNSSDEEKKVEQINLTVESYYGNSYNINWYISKLIHFLQNVYKTTFIKSDLDLFICPRTDDSQLVKKNNIKFIAQ